MSAVPEGSSRAHRARSRIAVTVACLGLALALAGLAQSSAGQQVTHQLGLFAPSEPYTELYFTDPRSVAADTEGYATDGRRTTVSFAIRNDRHVGTQYGWAISVGATVTARGSAQLLPKQHAVVARPVLTGCLASSRPRRVRITVALTRPAQSIGYWFTCRV